MIRYNVPWARKPPESIQQANPKWLNRGFNFGIFPDTRGPKDVVSGVKSAVGSTVTLETDSFTKARMTDGRVLHGANGTDDTDERIFWPATPNGFNGNHPFTIIVRFFKIGTTNSGIICAQEEDGSGANPFRGHWRLRQATSPNRMNLLMLNQSGTTVLSANLIANTGTDFGWTDNAWHTISITHNGLNGGTFFVYHDGVLSDSGKTAAAEPSFFNVFDGTHPNEQTAFGIDGTPGGDSKIAYWMTFIEQLTPSEISSLYVSPYQVLQPHTIYIPVEVAAVGGRIMSSLAYSGGLAHKGGIAGKAGGLAG